MQNLTINNNTPVQENFLGNGAIYHGFANMPDNAGRTYSEELCELEADRVGQMKLKIARTFYGAYAYDPETGTWDWENEEMQCFYAWLSRMQARNVDVAINIGWWSISDLTDPDGSPRGALRAEKWEDALNNYGNWVSESVHQIVEVHGFTNVKYVVVFTEPQHNYEGWLDELRAAHEALTRDGRRHLVKLMGPNEAGEGVAQMVKWSAIHASEYLDIYSSHCYQLTADLPERYRRTGRCSPMASIPGGRVQQTVKLKKNTNYTLKMVAAFHSTDPLHTSGNILFGAFDTSYGCVLAGGDPTSRISKNSVKMLDPAGMPDEYCEYSFTFSSEDHEEAYICFFYDVKQPTAYGRTFNGLGMPKSEVYVDSMHLYEENSDINLINNPDFSSGYEGWDTIFAGGSMDAYYEWYDWGKNGVTATPKGNPFIFDEYNTVFDRDNSRLDHGANICTAAIALMNSGVSASLIWTVFDQQWPNEHLSNDDSFVDGDHRCGTMPVLTRSLVPHKSFYAFTLLSRYTGGEGSKVYEGVGANNLHLTMNVLPDGNITIVVVNNKGRNDSFSVRFSNPVNISLNRRLFDPNTLVPDEKASLCDIDKNFEKITDTFSDEIPAYGIAVYTTCNW